MFVFLIYLDFILISEPFLFVISDRYNAKNEVLDVKSEVLGVKSEVLDVKSEFLGVKNEVFKNLYFYPFFKYNEKYKNLVLS